MRIILTVEVEDGIEAEVVIDGEDAEQLRQSVKGAMFTQTMSNATGYNVTNVEIDHNDE